MSEMILLENCCYELKLWYLLMVRKFIIDSYNELYKEKDEDLDDVLEDDDLEEEESLEVVEYEEEEVTDEDIDLIEAENAHDDGLEEDADKTRLDGEYFVYLLQLGVLIKFPFTNNDIYEHLFQSQAFWDKKLEELQQNSEVASFISEHNDLVYTSLLKDFIQINFKEHGFSHDLIDYEDFYDFIWSEDYFKESHMLVDENQVLLDFIEENNFLLDFAHYFESMYRYFTDNIYDADHSDKNLKEDIQVFNHIFAEDEDNSINSFYFSGTPYGFPAQDYIATLGKAFKLASRAKTVISTATAIATLSNPLTCTLGLASLGIATVSFLSKNNHLEKNTWRRAFLSGMMENNHQVKLLLQRAIEKETPSLQDKEVLLKQGIRGSLYYLYELSNALTKINALEVELMTAYLSCELPETLDLKRLDVCLKQFDNYESTREFVLSMFREDEGKFYLVPSIMISDMIRLKNIFDSIGYFTMTGYLKKFL